MLLNTTKGAYDLMFSCFRNEKQQTSTITGRAHYFPIETLNYKPSTEYVDIWCVTVTDEYLHHAHDLQFLAQVFIKQAMAAGLVMKDSSEYRIKLVEEQIAKTIESLVKVPDKVPDDLTYKSIADQAKITSNIMYEHTQTSKMLKRKSKSLPGMKRDVNHPCSCGYAPAPLWNVVIHLNDNHAWSREKIADWLDELHDAGIVNIEF